MPTKTNAPMPAAVEKGKTYFWCACGHSQNMPLCDGSHKKQNTGKTPVKFVAEKTKTAFLCGCTLTKMPPLCDGSHCNAPAE